MKTKLLALMAVLALVPIGPAALARAQAARAQSSHPTVVSLVPALTEMLFAIGAGPQVIGVSGYDNHPPEVARLPRMGALLDPNTERILAARPGLVLTYGSQQDLQTQLREAGIGVFTYRHAGLASIFTVMRELGRAIGHADEAERVAADLEKRLAAVLKQQVDWTLPPFPLPNGPLFAVSRSLGELVAVEIDTPNLGSRAWVESLERTPLARRYWASTRPGAKPLPELAKRRCWPNSDSSLGECL